MIRITGTYDLHEHHPYSGLEPDTSKSKKQLSKGFPSFLLPHLGKSAEAVMKQILNPQRHSQFFELCLAVDTYQKGKKLKVICCRSLKKIVICYNPEFVLVPLVAGVKYRFFS